jgi:hypothetical protein
MMEGSGSGSGSVPVNNRMLGGPKTYGFSRDMDPEHWFIGSFTLVFVLKIRKAGLDFLAYKKISDQAFSQKNLMNNFEEEDRESFPWFLTSDPVIRRTIDDKYYRTNSIFLTPGSSQTLTIF